MTTGDTLSPQEVQALLAAVKGGSLSVTPGQRPDPSRAESYNFRRPTRVSKDQIRAVGALHDEFAKALGASLSTMLRVIVDVRVEAVEQVAYSEYVTGLPATTCVFLFNMEPLKGVAVFELNPGLALVMIDRLLGGQGQEPPAARDLTEIERVVIERIGARALIDLAGAWQDVGAYACRILGVVTSAQAIQATAPTEIIVVATFTMGIGEATGRLTLGYPYPLLEPVLGRLGGQRWAAAGPSGPAPEARRFIARELAASRLGVRALLGRAQLTVGELLSLHPGQLIALDASPDHPVRVEVNGVPKFVGRAGTHRHRLAVEVLGPATERSVDR
jgi:flagellar motor switch protein FliM